MAASLRTGKGDEPEFTRLLFYRLPARHCVFKPHGASPGDWLKRRLTKLTDGLGAIRRPYFPQERAIPVSTYTEVKRITLWHWWVPMKMDIIVSYLALIWSGTEIIMHSRIERRFFESIMYVYRSDRPLNGL